MTSLEAYPHGFQPLFAPPRRDVQAAPEPAPAVARSEEDAHTEQALRALLHAARRMRARIEELIDARLHQLTCAIAADVLARELTLSPSDVREIAERLIRRYAEEDAVALRVHPDDAESLAGFPLPVEADRSLRRGDVTLIVRDGHLDASLGMRLSAVLLAL